MNSIYLWQRYWVPIGTSLGKDILGFNSTLINYETTQSGQTLEDLASIPCLILLGEPGTGKSNEVERYHSSDPNCLVCKYKLNRKSDERTLINAIESQSSFMEWRKSEYKRLYLFLDGLDEAALNIKTIHNVIVDWILSKKNEFRISELGATAQPIFFLRLTCRSAAWPYETTGQLKDIFGEDNVQSFALSSLTQKDVRLAARTEEIEDEQFVKSIVESEAIDFASEPITLKFLIGAFKQGKLGKGTDKEELYYDGCLRLCEEMNPAYRFHKTITATQRFFIASRIAMYMLITKRTGMKKNELLFLPESVSNNNISIEDIVGDFFNIHQTEVEVTLANIEEVLNTALFHWDEGHIAFKHKSYAEFLAAWHFSRLGLSQKLLSQLLTSQHDPMKAIPQLLEVVVWVAMMDKGALDLFKEHEPGVLIRINKLSQEQRKDIVSSLLKLAAKFELLDSYTWKSHYGNLSHNQLSGQLKSTIISRKKNIITRRIAIEIADACREHSLSDALISVLNNKKEYSYLRKVSAVALGNMIDDSIEAVLRVYALTPIPEDTDDELKGSALKALYPERISVEEMIKCITKIKQGSLYGSYKSFLQIVGQLIPDSDFEKALEILAIEDRFFSAGSGRRDFERFLEGIVMRAWRYNLSTRGIDSFATVLLKLRKTYIDFRVPQDARNRRALIASMLHQVTDPLEVHQLVGRVGSLIDAKEDWDWLIRELPTDSGIDRLKIARVLWLLFNFNDSERVVEFLEFIFASEHVKSAFQYFIEPIELQSDEAIKRKKEFQIHAEVIESSAKEIDKPMLDFSPVERAREIISEFSVQNLEAWWRFVHLLRIEPTKALEHDFFDFEFDITKLPLWSHLSAIHLEIFETAKKYLKHYRPKHNWMFTDTFDRRELAGYKALLLILWHDPEFVMKLSAAFWNQWFGTVIFCTFNTLNELPEERKLVLNLCWKANETNTQFYKTISKYLIRRLQSGQHKDLYDLYKLNQIKCDLLSKELLKVFKSEYCDLENKRYILDFLLPEDGRARRFCFNQFSKLASGNIPKNRNSIAILSASRLLLFPENDWSKFWKMLTKCSEARNIFLEAAPKFGFSESKHISSLNEKQKGDILIWLYQNFPPENDPKHNGAYMVSPRDEVRDYRSQILNSLINSGSVDAVSSLSRASRVMPLFSEFRWWVISAREKMRSNTWLPPSPLELRIALHNDAKRFVRSEAELCSVIIESLQRMQKKLQGNNPISFFLWDMVKHKNKSVKYLHKDENSLSDFVKMHLEYDLIGRNIIMNREVEIKRSTGSRNGSRTDLFIQAIAPENPEKKITVVIEVKGCWNKSIDNSM